MIVLRIRWRMIFQPWCWLRGHRTELSIGLHGTDPSVWWCRRCRRERPRYRTEWRGGRSEMWRLTLDAEGNVLAEDLMARAGVKQ